METDARQKRISAYTNSSERIQNLYGDLELGGVLGDLIQNLGFNDEQGSVLISIVGDIILGFYPKSELQKLLIQEFKISPDIAQEIEQSLKDFLERIDGVPILPTAPKVVNEKLDLGPATMKKSWETDKGGETGSPATTLGEVPNASNDLKERLELRPKNVIRQSFTEQKVEETDEEDDGPKPLTRTQILQSLTSKRTMASDIASIHKTD